MIIYSKLFRKFA